MRSGGTKTIKTAVGALLLTLLAAPCFAVSVTMSVRDADIAEVIEMLSRAHRVNVLLSEGVEGNVSLNLYEMELDRAIKSIADAAGYAVERRDGTYFIIEREDVGRHTDGGLTQVRTYKIQYSDPQLVADILQDYLSFYGQVTALSERHMLVVQDRPEFLKRIEAIVLALDREPRQILISAQIIEVTLDDSFTYGIDWQRFFGSDTVPRDSVGTRELSTRDVKGFFVEVFDEDFEVFLDALAEDGKARTLSTPKLLALEDQEAEVIVGDRQGYRETTTINQVTSETIKFLESGIILRVTPSVDERGRILMAVEPEISTGTVSDGIPSQTATAVNTVLLLEDGQTAFIGGLIKRSLTDRESGVPLLRSIPVVGRLFQNKNEFYINTETVVLITPHLVNGNDHENIVEAHDDSYAETVEILQQREQRWYR